MEDNLKIEITLNDDGSMKMNIGNMSPIMAVGVLELAKKVIMENERVIEESEEDVEIYIDEEDCTIIEE